MTLVSQGWTGYLTHLQEHHRYPAVKNLAKNENFLTACCRLVLSVSMPKYTDAPQPIRTHPPKYSVTNSQTTT